MIIQNNSPKSRLFHYKIDGVIFKTKINAYSSLDVTDLQDKKQIVPSTFDKRKNKITETSNKVLKSDFSIIKSNAAQLIVAAQVNGSGNITPSGVFNISKDQDVIFYMTPDSYTGDTIVNTTGCTFTGTVSSDYYNCLTDFKIGKINETSSVTGNPTGVTSCALSKISSGVEPPYIITARFTEHTGNINYNFASSYDLKTFTVNGIDESKKVVLKSPGNWAFSLIKYNKIDEINAVFY